MAIALIKEQKEEKRQRDNMRGLCNRIESAFNFKEIRTWDNVYSHIGWSEEYIVAHLPQDTRKSELTFPELKAFLQKQKDQLEERLANKRGVQNDPVKPTQQEPRQDTIGSTITKGDTTQSNISVVSDSPPSSPPVILPELEVSGQPKSISVPNIEENYGYVRSPNVNKAYFPYWFQKKAVAEILNGFLVKKKRGLLLLSSTGTGKTFMCGDVVRHLVDINFCEGKTWSHIGILQVTRATIVEQTKRVDSKTFNLDLNDVETINIEQLRASAGRMWVKETMTVRGGQEEWEWSWKKGINPCVIIWDECQALKNDTSTQHKIGAAFNDLPTKETYQLFVSATPFTRVCEAKCFAVSTHKDIEHLGFPPGTQLTNETWPAYAAAIAAPSKPDDYNEAAVERLMKDLELYVIRVKGVRPQFDAINGIEMISFETKEEKQYYDDTERRYMEKKAKMEAMIMAGSMSSSGIWPLVLLNERCMAAELCRKHHLAKKLKQAVDEGFAGVCALKCKATMIAVVKILVNDYNIPRDMISLVWGGGQTQLTDKQKAKAKIKLLSAKFEAMGMSSEEMIADMDLEEVEDRIIEELDPELRLGPQSQEERQVEIDKFQSGKSIVCLYTFKAGGVGLSLHHSDEFTKEKVRRKESGYAVEEDIKNIPVRPRRTFVAPTYSAIELVQGLGRAPRLTSLSNTRQTLLFYRNTVEEDVADIVSLKLRCLSRVVRMRESWQDVIVETAESRAARVREHQDNTPEGTEDNEQLTDGGEDE